MFFRLINSYEIMTILARQYYSQVIRIDTSIHVILFDGDNGLK